MSKADEPACSADRLKSNLEQIYNNKRVISKNIIKGTVNVSTNPFNLNVPSCYLKKLTFAGNKFKSKKITGSCKHGKTIRKRIRTGF